MTDLSDTNGIGGLAKGPSGILLSVIIISYRRDDALRDNLRDLADKIGNRDDVELVLVDNNEDATDRTPFLSGFHNAVCYKPGVNRGVAGGRNDGILKSSGRILVFLDDDAFVCSPDFLDKILQILSTAPEIGILAFHSTNFYTREMDLAEFPHTDKSRDPNKPFDTFRYIGVGHAIRRDVFAAAGTYDDDFFYAMEEFDFSYRAIKAGYRIRYSPEIRVLHKKNPAGRLPAAQMVERSLLNKMRVNFMHLPWRYGIVSDVLWNFYALWWSRGQANLPAVWRRYREWTKMYPEKRLPIEGKSLEYFRSCGATLWK